MIWVGTFLLAICLVLGGSGIHEAITGRRPPGALGHRGIFPRGRPGISKSWSEEQWRDNGQRLVKVSIFLPLLGVLFIRPIPGLAIGIAFIACGLVTAGRGAYEHAKGRGAPGPLMRSLLTRSGRSVLEDAWAPEDWRKNGSTLIQTGLALATLGLLVAIPH